MQKLCLKATKEISLGTISQVSKNIYEKRQNGLWKKDVYTTLDNEITIGINIKFSCDKLQKISILLSLFKIEVLTGS
jgi:hypothetical protein